MQLISTQGKDGPATYRNWDPQEWADNQYESAASAASGDVSKILLEPYQRGSAAYVGRNFLSPKPVRNQWPFVSLDTIAEHLEVPSELSASAFAERERLRVNEPEIHQILSEIETNDSIVERARIAGRLRALFEARIEEDPEDDPMSIQSLHCFLRFLCEVPNTCYPDIGVGPDGDLIVESRSKDRGRYVCEFLPDQRVVVLLVLPDVKYPYQHQRITSTVPVGSLRDFLQRNGAMALIESQVQAR